MEQQRKKLALAAEATAAAALIGAPLALGSVHLPVMIAGSALGCLALLLLALSLGEHGLHLGWLSPLLLAVLGVALLQLVPLPPGLVEVLAPTTAALYRAAGDTGWHPLSLDAAATAARVAQQTGWLCIFAVLQHRAGQSRRVRRRVLVYVAATAAAVALIGLGHWAVGEKRSLLGLYEYAAPRSFLSTLGNTNHLAGFLDVGALVALGLAAGADRTRKRLIFVGLFLLCVAGALLTASRGGAMALLAGLLVLPILGWGSSRRRESSGESTRSLLTVGGALAAATLLAVWLYSEFPRLLREIATLLDLSVADEQGKLEAYLIAWDAALAHPFFGIGRGAFESVHTLYLSKPWQVAFTHAENEPLQAVAELGFAVGGPLVAGFAAAWLALARRGRFSWSEAGAAAAAFALLLQNLVDFSLQFAPGLVLLALFAHRSRRELRVPGRIALGLALAAPVVVGATSLRALPGLDSDAAALVAAGADPNTSLDQVEEVVRGKWIERPAWYLPAEVAATRAAAEEGGAGRALPWLNEWLRLHPQSGQAHRQAGEVFARLGMRQQALSEFSMAAARNVPAIDRVLAHWPGDDEAVLAATPRESAAALAAAGPVDQAGRRELAIQLLERVPMPDVQVLRRLYWLRSGTGDHETALALAERMAPMAPNEAWPVAYQAQSLRSLRRNDEARARFEAALAIDRRNTDALFGLAELELAEKRPEEALEILEGVPVFAPDAIQTRRHWVRGRAFRAAGNLLKARDELRIAIERSPENVWYRITLADVFLDLRQLDRAEEILAPLAEEPRAETVRRRLEKARAQEQGHALDLLRERLER